MTCQQTDELIETIIARGPPGSETRAERSAIRTHLGACEACAMKVLMTALQGLEKMSPAERLDATSYYALGLKQNVADALAGDPETA